MGAGAVGCYVGGRLAAAGADVVFVGRARAKSELEASGLVTTNLGGESVHVPKEQIRFELEASALSDRDVVLCCVKSGQTREVAMSLAAALSPGAMIASLQNGVRNAGVLRAALPEQVVLGGVVSFNVVPKGRGEFRRATGGPLMIEASADPRVAALAGALEASGIDVEIAQDIRAHQWTKLVVNLNNALSALSDAPTRDLVFVSGYRRIVAAIVGEALDVLARAGIRTAPLRGVPMRLMPFALRLPNPMVRVLLRAQLAIDPEARSSMWEDLARRRATEIEFLNGEIVRVAASCGAAAPLNAAIVQLVHEAEKRGEGSPRLGSDALWRAVTTTPPA